MLAGRPGGVGVFGPVDGGEGEVRLREVAEDGGGGVVVGVRLADCFDDWVAGDGDAVAGDCLGAEVGRVALGGGAAQVGEVVDEDAVVFFWHVAVAAAQAGLDVTRGMAQELAARAPARAVLVSPWTTTALGGSSRQRSASWAVAAPIWMPRCWPPIHSGSSSVLALPGRTLVMAGS
jgi:hypothetical protein